MPKDIKLNSRYYLIIKIHNKCELQNIAIDHSADIDCNGFMNIDTKSTSKSYSCLTNDTTLPSDDPLHFKMNLLHLI